MVRFEIPAFKLDEDFIFPLPESELKEKYNVIMVVVRFQERR
jgi:hypothetical protein